jgi:hypothetical protein
MTELKSKILAAINSDLVSLRIAYKVQEPLPVVEETLKEMVNEGYLCAPKGRKHKRYTIRKEVLTIKR